MGWTLKYFSYIKVIEIKVMKKVIIAPGNPNLRVLSGGSFGAGTYRVIVKVQTGFMYPNDTEVHSAIDAFRQFKPKAIQSICYVTPEGYAMTVYARNGKKVWATESFLRDLTVGDINQDLHNTALYNQKQYQAVNAKTWADRAFVENEG
jgi:hypothetical protein